MVHIETQKVSPKIQPEERQVLLEPFGTPKAYTPNTKPSTLDSTPNLDPQNWSIA